MFEGYLDRSAEAKRRGRDVSRALCICRFGNDVLDAMLLAAVRSCVLRAALIDQRQSVDQVRLDPAFQRNRETKIGVGDVELGGKCEMRWRPGMSFIGHQIRIIISRSVW